MSNHSPFPSEFKSFIFWNKVRLGPFINGFLSGTSVLSAEFSLERNSPEPEFLNIVKCNLAVSASAGFQFNCNSIFND
jgi:hypothetical protein